MRRMPRASLVGVLLVFVVLMAGCAPGPNPLLGAAAAGHSPAGFWLGLWHGIILWVSFFISLFTHEVSVYEVHNTGWPYNLGFLLGAAGTLGGGVAGARRRGPKRSR